MIKQFLKMKIPAGLLLALRHLRSEIKILRMHRKGLRQVRKISNQKHLKLHIGCGCRIKQGWINIDLSPGADISLDMREPLPLHADSCSFIYSEHFLEHLDYPESTRLFLSECYRVLEPGGIFSVGVPDTEWSLLEYAGRIHDGYFELAKKIWHPKWCQTEIEHINYHFRQGEEHKFAYDFKTLVYVLENVGFQQVQCRDFSEELDSKHRKLGTLYVNASKPVDEHARNK